MGVGQDGTREERTEVNGERERAARVGRVRQEGR